MKRELHVPLGLRDQDGADFASLFDSHSGASRRTPQLKSKALSGITHLKRRHPLPKCLPSADGNALTIHERELRGHEFACG